MLFPKNSPMIRAVSLPKVSLNKIDTQETYEVNLFKRYVVFYRNKNSRIMCWSQTMKKLFDAGIVSQNFPRLKRL